MQESSKKSQTTTRGFDSLKGEIEKLTVKIDSITSANYVVQEKIVDPNIYWAVKDREVINAADEPKRALDTANKLDFQVSQVNNKMNSLESHIDGINALI